MRGEGGVSVWPDGLGTEMVGFDREGSGVGEGWI